MDTKPAITVTPIPRRPIYILCAILFCESFVSSMIFPFVNFMVRDFKIANSEAEVGYYSGYLASSFFLGQFVSSYFWGYLSDKYGRRPILLVGVFGSMVSATLFGFSPSYFWAIAIRSFGGLLNSNFAIARSYIGDITDATNRVRGFSFVGLMWGAGAIFGPVSGGLLANPSENVNVAPDSILLQYPYMLPSLLSGLLSLASWLVALLLLKESNKQVLIRKGLHSPVELDDLPSSSGGTEDSVSMMESSKLDPLIKEEAVHSPVLDGASSPSSAPSSGGIWSPLRSVVTALFQGGKNKKYSHIVEEDVEEESEGADFHTPHTAVEVEPSATPNTRAGSVIVMIFKERSVMVAISLLALASLCVVTIDELFPLWAMNPPPVGLEFKSNKIGMAWIIGGVTLVLFQGLIYPRLAQKVGLLTMIRYGSVGFAGVYMAFPMLSMLVGKGVLLWFGLGAVLFGRYVTGASVGTTLNILVNSVGDETVRKYLTHYFYLSPLPLKQHYDNCVYTVEQ